MHRSRCESQSLSLLSDALSAARAIGCVAANCTLATHSPLRYACPSVLLSGAALAPRAAKADLTYTWIEDDAT
jgi:hypothetical protein